MSWKTKCPQTNASFKHFKVPNNRGLVRHVSYLNDWGTVFMAGLQYVVRMYKKKSFSQANDNG